MYNFNIQFLVLKKSTNFIITEALECLYMYYYICVIQLHETSFVFL